MRWMVGVLGPWSRLRHRFVSAIPQRYSEGRHGMIKKRHPGFLFTHKSRASPLSLSRHWVIQRGLYHEFCSPSSSETMPHSGLSKAALSLQVILDIGITKDLFVANNHLVNLFHPSPLISLLLHTMPFCTIYSPCCLWYPWKTSIYRHFLLVLEKRWSARSRQKTCWDLK